MYHTGNIECPITSDQLRYTASHMASTHATGHKNRRKLTWRCTDRCRYLVPLPSRHVHSPYVCLLPLLDLRSGVNHLYCFHTATVQFRYRWGWEYEPRSIYWLYFGLSLRCNFRSSYSLVHTKELRVLRTGNATSAEPLPSSLYERWFYHVRYHYSKGMRRSTFIATSN